MQGQLLGKVFVLRRPCRACGVTQSLDRGADACVLGKHLWQMVRKFETNWQLVILLAPVALEFLRQKGNQIGEGRVAINFVLQLDEAAFRALIMKTS